MLPRVTELHIINSAYFPSPSQLVCALQACDCKAACVQNEDEAAGWWSIDKHLCIVDLHITHYARHQLQAFLPTRCCYWLLDSLYFLVSVLMYIAVHFAVCLCVCVCLFIRVRLLADSRMCVVCHWSECYCQSWWFYVSVCVRASVCFCMLSTRSDVVCWK